MPQPPSSLNDSGMAERARKYYVAIVVLTVIAGAVCECALYARRFSLWGDECALILNILHKSGGALYFGRLDLAGPTQTQAAPPLFLAAMKLLAGHWGGSSEYMMRLIPLGAGLLALPLFAVIAWRLLGAKIAVWIVPVFALSEQITVHAATAKQYSGDVLAALLLLAAALPWRRHRSPLMRLMRLSLLASAAFWFSYPSLFVFAALSLSLLAEMWRGGARGRLAWALANILPSASAIVLYLLAVRAQRDDFLLAYWANYFPDWSHPLSAFPWLVQRLWELYWYIQMPTGGLLLAAAIVGVVALYRDRRRPLLIALGGPMAMAVLAAALGKYPFGPKRVSLFLIPSALLLAGAGLEALSRQPYWRRVWWVVACLAVAAGVYHEGVLLAAPRPQSEIRLAVEYLRAHRRPHEPVYMDSHLAVSFQVYWPDPDPLIHLDFDPAAPIAGPGFWVIQGFGERSKPIGEFTLLGGGAAKVDNARMSRTSRSLVGYYTRMPGAAAAPVPASLLIAPRSCEARRNVSMPLTPLRESLMHAGPHPALLVNPRAAK